MAGIMLFACSTAIAMFSGTKQVYSFTSAARLFKPSYIINELPSYSFTVGDLHAHLLGLPAFLLNLILLFVLSTLKGPRALVLALLACSFATSGMTNAWDFITLASILISIALLKLVLTATEKDEPIKGKQVTSILWALGALGVLLCVLGTDVAIPT